MLPYDDRVEVPESCTPVILEKGHPIFAGLPKEQVDWPYMLGYNRLVPNPEKGKVLAEFEEDPYIVAGEFSKGLFVFFFCGSFGSDSLSDFRKKAVIKK